MKRFDMTYRLVKIGKIAASVAVFGMISAVPKSALAVQINLFNQTAPYTVIRNTDTDVIEVIYNSGGGGSNTTDADVAIVLGAGVDITGTTSIGTSTLGIYSRDTADGSATDFYTFGSGSTLTLTGGNTIQGLVGVNVNTNSSYDIDAFDIINIQGDVEFYDKVYSDRIEVNAGDNLTFYNDVGDVSSPSVLDLNGNDILVVFKDNADLAGSVVKNTSTYNSSLEFAGSSTITGNLADQNSAIGKITLKGGNTDTVTVNGVVSTTHLDFQANTSVSIGGNLYLNLNTSSNALNQVSMNDDNGILSVGGSIIGIEGKDVITTTDNRGTVNLTGGTSVITGHVGNSTNSLGVLNLGTSSASATTVNGDMFVLATQLQNNSGLTIASGYDLTGNLTTSSNGTSSLTLAGGTQTATGQIGTTTVRLSSVSSGVANGDDSTFDGDVFATTVSVGAGETTFNDSVGATTVSIGAGTANFNVDGGTTTAAILFTGAGVADLNQGLVGTIDFDGNDAVVNLADNKTISGLITDTTATPFNGTVNVEANGTLSGGVSGIAALNLNTSDPQSASDTTARVTLVNSNVTATDIVLNDGATLQVADNVNITGDITAALTGGDDGYTDNVLDLLGSSVVTGNVGTSSLALTRIDAGVTGEAVTFRDGTTYAELLDYQGTGTVTFENNADNNSATRGLGFVGTVDLNSSASTAGATLALGDGVDLYTQNADQTHDAKKTTFLAADDANLRFDGTSTIYGDLGVANGSANSSQNFGDIYAGSNGSVVTFKNDVYVSDTTLHVTGTGTVNLEGDLNGPLNYDADGFVNVADGQSITGAVTTSTNNTGTLSFVGSATTAADLGASSASLKAVNLHGNAGASALAVTSDDEVANIGHNIYAQLTTVGANTTANLTNSVNLGTGLTLADSTVTLNTAGQIFTQLANGRLSAAGGVHKGTVGNGALSLNGATVNFAINNSDWASNTGGTISSATSSGLIGNTATFNMNATDVINVDLLGSLRNGESYTLIDVASGDAVLPSAANYTDNSYVIDSTLLRSGSDLVVSFTRANDAYATLTNTATTDIAYDAAVRLGTLAAAGSAYSEDMQTVLNMLDIDQWGYGNNQANLTEQVGRMAPIANNSLSTAAFRTASVVADSIGTRMHLLRKAEEETTPQSLWVSTSVNSGSQDAIGQFDGFDYRVNAFSLGADKRFSDDSLVGVALSLGSTSVDQNGFRAGDDAGVQGTYLSLYGAMNITPEFYVGGTLSGGQVATESDRAAIVGRTARAEFDTSSVTGKVDLGYKIHLGDSKAYLTPIASFETTRLNQDAYTETGAGAAGLNVASQSLTRSEAAAGLRFEMVDQWNGMVVKPDLTVLATRVSGAFAKDVDSSFIGDTSATSFTTETIDTADYDTNGFKVDLGIGLLMSERSSMSLRAQHSSTGDTDEQRIDLTARWQF